MNNDNKLPFIKYFLFFVNLNLYCKINFNTKSFFDTSNYNQTFNQNFLNFFKNIIANKLFYK